MLHGAYQNSVRCAKFQSDHYLQSTNIFFYYSPDVLPATKATMLMLFHNRYFSAGPRWMCKCFPDSLQHCMYGVLRFFIAYGKLQK